MKKKILKEIKDKCYSIVNMHSDGLGSACDAFIRCDHVPFSGTWYWDLSLVTRYGSAVELGNGVECKVKSSKSEFDCWHRFYLILNLLIDDYESYKICCGEIKNQEEEAYTKYYMDIKNGVDVDDVHHKTEAIELELIEKYCYAYLS